MSKVTGKNQVSIPNLGYILGARELEESMHVISGASDSDGRTLNSAKNATEIGVSGLEQLGQRSLVEKMRCTSRLERDCGIYIT